MCKLIIFDVNTKTSLSVPLLSTDIDVDIFESDASGRIRQKFSNPGFGTGVGHEAKYNFPLQSSSAVHFFKSSFLNSKDQVITSLLAVSMENQEAKEKYEQAKVNGQTAQLMVQDYSTSPDVFEMSLGNIPPECSSVIVEIEYFVPLFEEESGSFKRFLFPAIVGNRYGAISSPSGNVSTGKSKFDIKCAVTMNSNLSIVESPTHKISTKLMVDKSPRKALATLALDSILDKDFVLKLSAEENSSGVVFQDPETIKNLAFLEKFGDSTIAKLSFAVPLAAKEKTKIMKKNFVFVVDRSGSMSGASIENCIKALQLCLTSLPEMCTFNICSFGSSHQFLFPESVEYSETNVSHAREAISKFQADLGGTEVLQPLQVIFKQAGNLSLPTVVFLLTDGEVSNTEAVIAAVKTAHSECAVRLFTCGIGSSVSTHLVEGLAKAAKGTATFIAYGERMNAKLASQMNEAVEDPLQLGKVDLGELKLSTAELGWGPEAVLPTFAFGGKVVSFYLPLNIKSLVDVSKVDCKLFDASGVVVASLTTISKTKCNLLVPALSERIKHFSEKKSDRKKAVELAVAGNLVSQFTSLVAVDEAGQKIKVAEIVAPPLYQASPVLVGGNHLILGRSAPNYRSLAAPLTLPPSAPSPSSSVPMMKMRGKKKRSKLDGVTSAAPVAYNPYSAEATESKGGVQSISPGKYDILDVLIVSQGVNGSFTSSAAILKALGIKDFGPNEKVDGFITAVVVVYLETKMNELKGEWQLMHQKAIDWLSKTVKSSDEILKLAAAFVQAL